MVANKSIANMNNFQHPALFQSTENVQKKQEN